MSVLVSAVAVTISIAVAAVAVVAVVAVVAIVAVDAAAVVVVDVVHLRSMVRKYLQLDTSM